MGASASGHDLVIHGGRWFDGTGAPGVTRDLGIRDGVVTTVSTAPLPHGPDTEVIDAAGRWVLPGLIDIHTHYDAEVLVNPGLGESVRHGVTTILMGSCSLSTILSTPVDAADMFSRVEAVPYEHVLGTLEAKRTWSTPAEYIEALEALPLGPNVSCFLGHSDLRAHVMGLGRSVDPDVTPSPEELDRMETLLEEALAAGLLGLSTMTTRLDKLDGDRFRSRPLPSTHARWSEYRRLNKVLRRHGRVLQSAPDARMPANVALFLAESRGLFRPSLRTSLLVAADAKSIPGGGLAGRAVALHNRMLGSDVRLQHLPVPFELYSDGIDLPVFEELGAGAAALHLRDQVEREELMQGEQYRRRFRRQYERTLLPGLWHKDLYDAEIVGCPDPSVVGRSFGEVADERGIHPVDAFLDLIVEHGGDHVRWRTTVANHRPEVLDRMAGDPGVHLGFSDAGAHLRNMAFYNFGLRLLRRVRDAEAAGRPFLSLEAAVHRLTGELGEWFGLDAGTLRVGDRADLVVVDPEGLDASVDAYHEEPLEAFGGLSRMVRRNDAAVAATCIAGHVVFRDGEFTPGYGRTRRSGQFLKGGRVAERSMNGHGTRSAPEQDPTVPVTEHVVLANSVALAVYERGEATEDRPTIVMTHGWPDSAGVWDLVADRLAAHFHVVTYDMRGTGRSTRALVRRPYALDQLASDLDAVLAAVSPDRPVHLVGHDWGSVVGWEHVMTPSYQPHVASFTSLSGPNLDHTGAALRGPTAGTGPRDIRALLSQAVRSWYTAVLSVPVVSTLPWRLGADRMFRRWLRLSEGIQDYPGSGAAADAIAAVPLYRTNIVPRLRRPNLRPVVTPVHLIVAARDRYVSPRLLATMDRWLPSLTRSEIDAGHWSPRSHPDELAELIATFIVERSAP